MTHVLWNRLQRQAMVGMALLLALPDGVAHAQEPQATRTVIRSDTTQAYSLRDCLQYAMRHSRHLRDARLGLEVAKKQVREAWGEIFPTIDANMSYTRNLTDQTAFLPAIIFDPSADPGDLVEVRFSGDNLWNTTLVFEQPIIQAEAFIGVGAASRFRRLEDERLRFTSQQTVTDVRTNYYRMVLAQEYLRVIQSSIVRVQQTLAGARGLEHAGLGSAYDVLRLEVELASLEPNQLRAQNAVENAQRDLKLAMGFDMDQPLRLRGELYTLDVEDLQSNSSENRELLEIVGVEVKNRSDAPGVLELAQEHQSALQQARLTTALASSQLSAERATVYPKLSAFATYRLDAQENGSLNFFGENEMQRSSNWQAGVRLQVPLLEGGQRYARISQRRLQLEQSRTREALAEQALENDVQTLVAQVLEARERAIAQKRAVAQAQRGYEIALAEYTSGLGTQLAANDAEVALRQAEFNYAQAAYDMLQFQAELDAAVGVVPFVDASAEETP